MSINTMPEAPSRADAPPLYDGTSIAYKQPTCREQRKRANKKGLLHIVLAESAAVIFKIKRITKQFKKHVHHKSIEYF